MDDDCQVLAEDNNNDQNVQINEDDDPLIAEVGYGNRKWIMYLQKIKVNVVRAYLVPWTYECS
jgi:hypothetical protein